MQMWAEKKNHRAQLEHSLSFFFFLPQAVSDAKDCIIAASKPSVVKTAIKTLAMHTHNSVLLPLYS